MTRWEPGSRERLQDAALDLFVERGYDDTTVADIAERAGLSERTFFRYFADKREVLFSGSQRLLQVLAESIAAAPKPIVPLAAVATALEAAAAIVGTRTEHISRRQSVIAAHPELRERELVKLATFADVLTESLRARGVKEARARLAAEAGVAAFKVAFERWAHAPTRQSLLQLYRSSLDDLRALTST